MMLEIPDLHPFRVEKKGRISIQIRPDGAVLDFNAGDPPESKVILTLSKMDAHLLGAFLGTVGIPSYRDRIVLRQISGTFVEGAK